MSKAAPVRVGLFGLLGAGNIGNDASMEAVLKYLRDQHPAAIVDALCRGPEEVSSAYGIPATPLYWRQKFRPPSSRAAGIGLLILGKAVDVVRTAAWVRRHQVVIVPGMGTLETTLPVRPWESPWALFALSLSGRLTGAKVALVSVGAGVIRQPATRWLFSSAARLAAYRSYRDEPSRAAMAARVRAAATDPVYPDLVFGLPIPRDQPGDPQTVCLGVMAYHGSNDERERSAEIHAAYVAKMKQFALWLVDSGRRIRLCIGDAADAAVAGEILEDLGRQRPGLTPEQATAEPVASFDDVLRLMTPAGTVVAMRFHNVLAALRLGKPTLCIGYATKSTAVMADMGLAEFCLPVRSLEVDQLIRQFKELEDRAAELRQTLDERNAANERLLDSQFARMTDVLLEEKRS